MSARDDAIDAALLAAWCGAGKPSADFAAALTAAGYTVEQGWQDIATAPRDGTEVWAWNGEQVRMRWEGGEQWSGWLYADELLNDADPEPDPPTHWRPLPAPPAEKEPQP